MDDDDINRAEQHLEEKIRQQDEQADAWDPAPGEMLVGRVVDYIPNMQTSDGVMPLAKIEERDSGKRWAVWLNRKVLMDQWSRAGIGDGDAVAIVYRGTRQSQASGREYHDYIVAGDPESESDAVPPGNADEPSGDEEKEEIPDLPKEFDAGQVGVGEGGGSAGEVDPDDDIPF